MQVGDLVVLDAHVNNGNELTGVILKIDKNQKVGETTFPYFVSWSTGDTDWMRKDFLRLINASR